MAKKLKPDSRLSNHFHKAYLITGLSAATTMHARTDHGAFFDDITLIYGQAHDGLPPLQRE